MWSETRRQEFEALGWTRLPGLVDTAVTAEMLDRVWRQIEYRHGYRRDDPATWQPGFVRKLDWLRKHDAFAELACAPVRALLDAALPGWQEPPAWGQPLALLPVPVEFAVPSAGWHLDYTAPGGCTALPGVQLFLLLSEVAPRSGGTLVLAGSHRLVARDAAARPAGDPGRSAEVRKRLARRSAWLRDLWSDAVDPADRVALFVEQGAEVDGVALRVMELAGAPGDVLLMHPWMLHAAPLRCGPEPRIVVTERIQGRRGTHPL